MPPTPRQTLTDVARVAGISRAAASYALRGDVSVSRETVERVRKIAAEMGYRPDLRLSSLMAHIRRNRLPRSRETLAFVWVSTYPGETFPAYHQHYLRTILSGAKHRANHLGCDLAEFWLDEPGMTPARLARILRTRGITGVVFSPAMHDLAIALEWEWAHFACAVIGNTEWTPALHRAGHYHYRSMWLTLQRLRDEGYRRPAAILSRSIHERIHGVHAAAFQVNHPSPRLAPKLVQFALPGENSHLRRWRSPPEPDALIIGWPVYAREGETLRKLAPAAKRIVTLDWQPRGMFPGVDVMNDQIAASAVDLVVAQLHRNDRGIPAQPS
ncbi:MAG: LacI family DNA-binding transcriptional regulator, partial [Opitutaceae bacterium]